MKTQQYRIFKEPAPSKHRPSLRASQKDKGVISPQQKSPLSRLPTPSADNWRPGSNFDAKNGMYRLLLRIATQLLAGK
ncbi:hypothetical protein [Xanthomonas translucens]|uniref:Uncharacterized protein n=1 Tax=Xanthomonas translucens pv. translucens TaxID=134875 RepID=A0ABW9L007_XANCT|nr:hypothetical protein [Xanthomonas translucens]